jgi:uncharacterized protein (TIGR02145 family)
MNIEKMLLASLMTLALVACSDVNELVPNAPSGEPAALSSSSDDEPVSSSSEQIDGSEKVYKGITVYTVPFDYVKVYELDPVTFDTTKSMGYNWITHKGALNLDSCFIDSLSLKSPYVMFSTDYFMHRYNIVDIREANAFAVNKKSYFESIRTLYLVKSGKSFAEAKKQASKEVLEAFGSYAYLFDKSESENVHNESYRNYMAFIEDFMEVTTEDTVVAKLEKCGNITCGTDFLKKRFLTESLNMLMHTDDVLTGVTEADEQDMHKALNIWEARRNRLFLGAFVAHLLEAGMCSAEKEGNAFNILDKNVMLTCRSGIWEFSYKEMEYSTGTMTDARDGKTYKTVTYDIGGKTQTWMTERLNYAPDELQASCEHGYSGCEMYYIGNAFSLDSSIVESKESCMKRYREECPECDSSYFDYDCMEDVNRVDSLKFRQHVDSVMAEKGGYQGVCPDGWRIPTRGDLDSLLDYMVEWYDSSLPKYIEGYDRKHLVYQYLFSSSLGEPSGFGLKRDDYDFYVIGNNNACSAMERGHCFDEENSFLSSLYVRCIKN